MTHAEQMHDDDARDSAEFLSAARGIVVREQCSRCHCETRETIGGECATCAAIPRKLYTCTCGGTQMAGAGQSHVRCPQCSGVAV